jgi:hypothetical protein
MPREGIPFLFKQRTKSKAESDTKDISGTFCLRAFVATKP